MCCLNQFVSQIQNKLHELYQEDNTKSDLLLVPQRWCNHQWCQLTYSLNSNSSRAQQASLRVVKMTLLVFPTVVSYGIGLVGVFLKTVELSKFPPMKVEAITSLIGDATNELPPSDPIVALPPSDGTAVFRTDSIGEDPVLYMATFLTKRQRAVLMSVCKQFQKLMKSPVLWSEYLVHPDVRIWGGTHWSFKSVRGKGGRFTPEQTPIVNNPYDQLSAYHKLRIKNEAGPANRFFDYLARLLPGGPVKFLDIHRLTSVLATSLTVENMPEPIVCGVDRLKNRFLAMRLVDQSKEDKKPFILVFIHHNSSFADDSGWKQVGNALWPENSLKVTNDETLNYILALISKEDLSKRADITNPILKKTIKLSKANAIPVSSVSSTQED